MSDGWEKLMKSASRVERVVAAPGARS